jgi:hypothetical protein
MLVLIAGVFHQDGWAPGVLDPAHEPPDFLRRLYGEVSPDGATRTARPPPFLVSRVTIALIMVPVITGLYGGTLFVPTALTALRETTHAAIKTPYLIAIGGSIIAAFTLVTCLIVPSLAQRFGRKRTLGLLLALMAIGLPLVFLLAFKAGNLGLFLALLVLLGIGGADFAVFSLWLPEVYPTHARAGGFAFVTTVGPFAGAHLRDRRAEHRGRPRHVAVAHRDLLRHRLAAAPARATAVASSRPKNDASGGRRDACAGCRLQAVRER